MVSCSPQIHFPFKPWLRPAWWCIFISAPLPFTQTKPTVWLTPFYIQAWPLGYRIPFDIWTLISSVSDLIWCPVDNCVENIVPHLVNLRNKETSATCWNFLTRKHLSIAEKRYLSSWVHSALSYSDWYYKWQFSIDGTFQAIKVKAFSAVQTLLEENVSFSQVI